VFARHDISGRRIGSDFAEKFQSGTAGKFSSAKGGLDFAKDESGAEEKTEYDIAKGEPKRIFGAKKRSVRARRKQNRLF
jgi:hypothetical protein